MKLYKSILASIALCGTGMMLTGCQNHFDDPVVEAPVATMKANTTIADLKREFMNTNATLVPEKENGEHYIIHGRVISSDASGNIYKALVIQDETAALTFSINRASLYNYWHVGQELVVDLTGLYIGKYNNLLQIGWLGEYNGEDQLTFVDFDMLYSHVEMNGFPKTDVELVEYGSQYPADKMYKIVMTPSDVRNITALSEECYLTMSQLVELRDVEWLITTPGLTYAPFQETVNRYIQNESKSDKICVRNSGYANFYNVELPAGTGSLSGILSWYGNGTASSTDPALIPGWQILIRSLQDVVFDSKGSYEEPFTIAEAIERQGTGAKGWTEGYIVGSVLPGVANVESNDDINFSTTDHIANNIVIAPSADVRDWKQCVAVALPQDSEFRQYVNLEQNPANLGKKIMIRGNLENYLGMAGISGSAGTTADFDLEGLKILKETVIYNGLVTDAAGWTYDNITMPSALKEIWSWNSKYSYLNGTAYDGKANAALSYAISPEIDLTGVESPKVVFDHKANYQRNIKELGKLCVREAGTTQWTEYSVPQWPTSGTWNAASSGEISIESFAGKKVQVALKYESTSSAADTWEVYNLVISGLK